MKNIKKLMQFELGTKNGLIFQIPLNESKSHFLGQTSMEKSKRLSYDLTTCQGSATTNMKTKPILH